MIHRHGLDASAADALRVVVAAVEKSWYAGRRSPDGRLTAAVQAAREGLQRSEPLGLRARLLPPSLLGTMRPPGRYREFAVGR
jgi:hypothetical protein